MNINKFKSFFNAIKATIYTDTKSKSTIFSNNSRNLYRESSSKFPKVDADNRMLKYEYYDVPVKGLEYREFDLSQIKLEYFVRFEFETNNKYDSNAIKILYNNNLLVIFQKTIYKKW